MELSKEIRCVISTKLAEGMGSQEIVEVLCASTETELEEQDAIDCLQEYYCRWQTVIEALGQKEDDHFNWHVYMRHAALKIALRDSKPAAALSILDSLAKLQGLSDIKDDRIIPLKIELIEKEDKDDKATGKQQQQQLPKEEERNDSKSINESINSSD